MTDLQEGLFVIDANVLIDFLLVDKTMLQLMATQLGPIHVPRRVLEEITEPALDVTEYENIGLRIVIEDMEELESAISLEKKGLSVPDKVVLIMAQRRSWTPITNDNRLRAAMLELGITPKWGLEMLLQLVHEGHVSSEDAIKTAQAIIDCNPRMRSGGLLSDFEQKAKRRR